MDPLLSPREFSELRAFVAVAETRSFSRAAERLGVTPSALSQMVRGLEERVRVRLLNRTTRSVALTEAGETLLGRLRPAVAELGAAVGQVRRTNGRPSGTVRVVSFRSAVEQYVEPVLASFHAAYPEVVLDLTVDDTVNDFVAGGFDAAIRLGEVIERDLVAVRLGPELRQIAVASPDYLARRGTPRTPQDLTAHSCIRWRWPGTATPYHWEFWQDDAWFEVAVDGPLIVNSKDFALRAALAGLGIHFAVDQVVRPYLADGRLVPLLEAWSAPFPGLFLCYPRQRQMAPALRAFIDHLRSATRDTA
ncbi:LysR family transcriptional regulator [Pyxidicoccus fallax]|uniref:LysR family transcriptional regulator n=1 Tax=Pyxidicoccus fallax TaxID=394095 RepID=A0A848LAZ7_9BACT|nr:LysR family transcriptional regulator [Pyxidicoccus fallax]NMO15684.1 LysR family transcriptional regulator [Pyxidicoccus fallax]NPC77091.1 LysR family transcriptional regulator [Pyxidicoccus fallax]